MNVGKSSTFQRFKNVNFPIYYDKKIAITYTKTKNLHILNNTLEKT